MTKECLFTLGRIRRFHRGWIEGNVKCHMKQITPEQQNGIMGLIGTLFLGAAELRITLRN